MPPSTGTLLVQYRYDPLDELTACMPAGLPGHQRFYQRSRLATEIQSERQYSFFQQEDYLLAQTTPGLDHRHGIAGHRLAAFGSANAGEHATAHDGLSALRPQGGTQWRVEFAGVQRRTSGSRDGALSIG